MTKTSVLPDIDAVLPDWFSLKKYKQASSLGQFEWYVELSTRRAIQSHWLVHGTWKKDCCGCDDWHSRLCQEQWELIQRQGLVSLPEGDETEEKEVEEWERGEALHQKFFKDICDLRSIQTLTRLEGYGFFWFAPDQKTFIKKLGIYQTAHQEEVARSFPTGFPPGSREAVPSVERTVDDEQFERVVKWLNGRCRHAHKEGAFIHVNLKASDEQIKKDFDAWLAYERKYQARQVPKKNFTALDFADWCDWKLLPYLDLSLWSQMSGVKITDYTMGEVLFKRGYGKAVGVDPQGKLKTTKKKVQYLFSDDVLEVLNMTPESP